MDSPIRTDSMADASSLQLSRHGHCWQSIGSHGAAAVKLLTHLLTHKFCTNGESMREFELVVQEFEANCP